MSPRRLLGRIRDDEGGAALILTTFTVTLLLFFAAVAIDAAGFGFNERRQSQSAADVGALTAVQFAVPVNIGNLECNGYTGLARARCNGAAEAIDVANATLIDPSLVDWTNPTKCPAPPAGYSVSPITNCVAFNANNQRAWVRIPLIEKPTTIAKAVGIRSINISADAIAGTSFGFRSNVLPFLSPGNAAGVHYNCLKSGPNPNFGACADNPTIGNFGYMDFFMYGNADLGYTERCTGDTQGRLAANIARGVDHPLGTHPTGGPGGGSDVDRLEPANCPNFNALPNMVYSQTGVGTQQAFEAGILYGGTAYSSSAYPGRIQVTSGGALVRNAQGPTPLSRVDDTPLWSFLLTPTTTNGLLGTPCDRNTVNNPALMVNCLTWAKAQAKVVFNDDLATSIRFGFTPLMWEPNIQSPSMPYHIRNFLPVYIDTIFFGCNNNGCAIMYTPGVADIGSCPNNPPESRITCGTPGAGNQNLVGVSAYVLSASIVPDSARSPYPGATNQLRFSLIE